MIEYLLVWADGMKKRVMAASEKEALAMSGRPDDPVAIEALAAAVVTPSDVETIRLRVEEALTFCESFSTKFTGENLMRAQEGARKLRYCTNLIQSIEAFTENLDRVLKMTEAAGGVEKLAALIGTLQKIEVAAGAEAPE